MNEVVMLTAVANDAMANLHWLERPDAFIDQVCVELAKAPAGCRSFDFDIMALPSTGDGRQSLRLGFHAEIETLLNRHALVLSLAGRQSLVA